MSRVFIDENLLSWEAYPSAGRWGLPDRPKIVFNCLSEPDRRARYVTADGDSADAEQEVQSSTLDRLRQMLAESAVL